MRYILFDRSRHEALEKCPRLRFLAYEWPVMTDIDASFNPVYNANGLERVTRSVPLLSGGVMHAGIESFLQNNDEEQAIKTALDRYDKEIAERGIYDETTTGAENSKTEWTIKVQRTLCEALIRGWCRVMWPQLQEQFDVVRLESEDRLELPWDEETMLVLMARSDAVLRRKSDGRLFVINHKSISEPTDRRIEQFRYDSQSISEVLAAEASLTQPSQVDGVIYDLMAKGPKRADYPRGSQIYHNTSPLIWAYVKEGQTAITNDEIACRWEYTCTAPHKMGNGHLCEGDKSHKLNPQYKRRLVSDYFENGVVAWFDWLEEHDPQLIREQFIMLQPVMRTPFDVEVWKRSVLTAEYQAWAKAEDIRQGMAMDGDNSLANVLPILDAAFPKHTAHGNCLWPNRCTMFNICWGPLVDDPTEAGEYTSRVPNHPEAVPEESEA